MRVRVRVSVSVRVRVKSDKFSSRYPPLMIFASHRFQILRRSSHSACVRACFKLVSVCVCECNSLQISIAAIPLKHFLPATGFKICAGY